MSVEQHYTPRQVADLLAVSEETVRRLALRGEIRSVAVGGQRRFAESAVREYLEHGDAGLAEVVVLPRRRHALASTTRRVR